jgi:hypothetical protein
MTHTDDTRDTDSRFWDLSTEARLIGACPNPGRPEVERLAQILEEMTAIVADLPAERHRRALSRYHQGRGRAVDFLPPSPLAHALKHLLPAAELPTAHPSDHGS